RLYRLAIAPNPANGRAPNNYAQQTELAQFLDRRQRDVSDLIPLHDMGRNFTLSKLAHAFLKLKLFVVELENQDTISVSTDVRGPLGLEHRNFSPQSYRRKRVSLWGGHSCPPPLTLFSA